MPTEPIHNSAFLGDSRALAAEVDEHVQFDEASAAAPNPETLADDRRHYENYPGYLDQLRPMFQ